MRLLQAGKVLSAALGVAAPLEATMAVAAPGALTGEAMLGAVVTLETPKAAEVKEEVMGEARGVIAKLKE